MNSAIFRRELLLKPPLIGTMPIAKKWNSSKPSYTKSVEDTPSEFRFQSQNDRFAAWTVFQDAGDTVIVNTRVEWFDPVTESVLSKISKDIYLIDTNST